MKRSLQRSILLVVVLVAIPCLVSAQDFRNVELNLFVAGSAHTKNLYDIGFPQSISPINGEFHFKEAVRGGARFNVNTSGHWGEEFFFSYEPNQAHFIRKTNPTQDQAYDIRIYNVGVNAMYYLNEEESRATRLFLSSGLGASIYQPTASALTFAHNPLQGNLPGFASTGSFAFNYGGGFKHRLSENFGFRMDVRGFVTRNPSFGLPRSSPDANVVVFPANGAINSLEVSAGIIIKFHD